MRLEKNQLLSWGKFLIGWPLSILSIFFIIKLIADKGGQISLDLNNINYVYLSLGVIFFFLYFLLRSFLWQQTLRQKGYQVSFRENTYRFTFSEFKRYVPGNMWSFLSRGSQFSELGIDKKTVGISILADIQLVIIGCGIVSLLSIPWLLDSPIELKVRLASLLPISIVGIAIFFVATALFYSKKYNTSTLRRVKVFLFSNLFLPGFDRNSKIKLSAISTITYFVFGVGNYFAMLSIFPTELNSFLSLTSFFVFSLLIGYLSFITPMGLGVREGVVTLGLSKLMSISNAATISIFTRIVLIASEVLFLIIILIWEKSYRK